MVDSNENGSSMQSIFQLADNLEMPVTETVDIKKNISSIMKEARYQSKRDRCFYCGKQVSKFCNSHSVPAFTLRNIAHNGKLATLNALINLSMMPTESGVNNAGTFHFICNNCDSKIFSDYENPLNYNGQDITQKMMAQMALKNYLLVLSKRSVEEKIYSDLKGRGFSPADEMLSTINLDYQEFLDGYNKVKRSIEKEWDSYYLISHMVLDYRVPIAFQDKITLVTGFDDEIVNNVMCKDEKYQMKDLHICVLPLENSTEIIMFIDYDDMSRYRNFYKKFRTMVRKKQLEVINYLIFAYSENFFLSPLIPQKYLNNVELINVSRLSTVGLVTDFCTQKSPIDMLVEKYTLHHTELIPNLLCMNINQLSSD